MRTSVALVPALLTVLTLLAMPAQADLQSYVQAALDDPQAAVGTTSGRAIDNAFLAVDKVDNMLPLPEVAPNPFHYQMYGQSAWRLCLGTTVAGNSLVLLGGRNIIIFVGYDNQRPDAGATQDSCPPPAS